MIRAPRWPTNWKIELPPMTNCSVKRKCRGNADCGINCWLLSLDHFGFSQTRVTNPYLDAHGGVCK